LTVLQEQIEAGYDDEDVPAERLFQQVQHELDSLLDEHHLEEFAPSFPEDELETGKEKVEELYGSLESLKILAEAWDDDPGKIKYGDNLSSWKQPFYNKLFKYGFMGYFGSLGLGAVEFALNGTTDIWQYGTAESAMLVYGSLGLQATEVGLKKKPSMLAYGLPLTAAAGAMQYGMVDQLLGGEFLNALAGVILFVAQPGDGVGHQIQKLNGSARVRDHLLRGVE